MLRCCDQPWVPLRRVIVIIPKVPLSVRLRYLIMSLNVVMPLRRMDSIVLPRCMRVANKMSEELIVAMMK